MFCPKCRVQVKRGLEGRRAHPAILLVIIGICFLGWFEMAAPGERSSGSAALAILFWSIVAYLVGLRICGVRICPACKSRLLRADPFVSPEQENNNPAETDDS